MRIEKKLALACLFLSGCLKHFTASNQSAQTKQSNTSLQNLATYWACADTDMSIRVNEERDAQGVLETELKPNFLCSWTTSQAKQCRFELQQKPQSCASNPELCARLAMSRSGCDIAFTDVNFLISAKQRKVCTKKENVVTCAAKCNDVSKHILVKLSYNANCRGM